MGENKDHGKILVIEDNQDVLTALQSLLEYCGFQSLGVTSFSETVFEQLKTEPFALVIIDVMLSGTDGRDLAKRLKNTVETKTVPILMTSAYPNVEDSVKLSGADDFLPKPFGIEELREKLNNLLLNTG